MKNETDIDEDFKFQQLLHLITKNEYELQNIIIEKRETSKR